MLLHLHEWGDADAPPLLCVHGVQAHGLRFRKLAEERLASGFRVLAPDLRGHGRSGWEPPWTIERHVDDLLETLGAAGVERATVVGHSFGGRLTLELTARGAVERSVLLDPVVWVPPPIALARAQALVRDRSFTSEDEALAERRPLSPLAPRELLDEEFREHLVRHDDGRLRFRYATAAVIAAYGELSEPPPDWARVQVPTLLVVGAETDVAVPALVEAMRFELGERLTDVTVPGRHVVLWDAFDETADAIDAFLR
ncbi:MAG TPA: alpha/beta hydrolase [Gaiellaceae bacterium]|nr:alpha/beta hydrolase [Gaiellaceae bacterium]